MNSKYDEELVVRLEQFSQVILDFLAADGATAAEFDGTYDLDVVNSVDERYEFGSKVAEGGLGSIESVTDRRLMRTVARKRSRAGSPPRLAREVRLLSRLQHPNILPLYEAIFAGDGQVEGYTMPLLTGESLRDRAKRFHADRPRRDSLKRALAPLLSSFGDVCQAIGYAHSRGVWHLDLKGSNVLVDASGATVVIDWNMALTDEEPPLADAAPGTPGYQAPEQASGGTVGPATDVHGLGALLYELLTGQPPFEGANRDARARRACSGPPEPPHAVWPAVPRALEAICLKAMSTDPKSRFRSPEELHIEVDRWRNDERVACFPESAWARLARWGRRHPRYSGAILTLLLATSPVLIGSLVHVERQRRVTVAALHEARANFAEVLQAGERYFTTMSDNRVLKGDGLQPLRQDLLANGLAFYQEFLERRGDTPELRREIAIGWAKLAWLQARDESRSGAGPAARRALALLENQLESAASDVAVMSWKAKALIVLAEALHDDGQLQAASAVLDRLDLWLDQHAAEISGSLGSESLAARSQSARASLVAEWNPADALPVLRAARATYDRIAADQPSEDNHLHLASILTKEASVARELGQFSEARRRLSRAGEIYEALLEHPDPLPVTRRGMSTVEHLLGLVAFETGDCVGARQHLLAAYHERQSLAKRNPDNKYRCHEASTAAALAKLYRQTGPREDAESWLLQAHQLLQQCIDDHHPNSHLWTSALEVHCRAGWLLFVKGQFAAASSALRATCDLAELRAHSGDESESVLWGAAAAFGRMVCEFADQEVVSAACRSARRQVTRLWGAAGETNVGTPSGTDP